ncbi:MAG: hypothetical protein V3W19_08215 [Desulfatiglandales bacterium]
MAARFLAGTVTCPTGSTDRHGSHIRKAAHDSAVFDPEGRPKGAARLEPLGRELGAERLADKSRRRPQRPKTGSGIIE